MFDFFNDMFAEAKKCFFRYQVNNGTEIVFEGYKNILLVSAEKIVLKVQNGEVEILGNNLCIKELCSATLKVNGSISGVQNCIGDVNAKK